MAVSVSSASDDFSNSCVTVVEHGSSIEAEETLGDWCTLEELTVGMSTKDCFIKAKVETKYSPVFMKHKGIYLMKSVLQDVQDDNTKIITVFWGEYAEACECMEVGDILLMTNVTVESSTDRRLIGHPCQIMVDSRKSNSKIWIFKKQEETVEDECTGVQTPRLTRNSNKRRTQEPQQVNTQNTSGGCTPVQNKVRRQDRPKDGPLIPQNETASTSTTRVVNQVKQKAALDTTTNKEKQNLQDQTRNKSCARSPHNKAARNTASHDNIRKIGENNGETNSEAAHNPANQNVNRTQNLTNQNVNRTQNPTNQNVNRTQNPANQNVNRLQTSANQNMNRTQNPANQDVNRMQTSANQNMNRTQNPANQNVNRTQNPANQTVNRTQNLANQNVNRTQNPANQNVNRTQNPANQNLSNDQQIRNQSKTAEASGESSRNHRTGCDDTQNSAKRSEGKGSPRKVMIGETDRQYTYKVLNSLKSGTTVDVFGVVKFFKPPTITRTSNYFMVLSIVDPSMCNKGKVKCIFFAKNSKDLPPIQSEGEIVRMHRLKVGTYNGELQGQNGPGFSCLVFSGDTGDPIEPKSTTTGYTLTEQDRKKVEELREWIAQGDSLSQGPDNSVTLSNCVLGEYFDLVCQVVGCGEMMVDVGKCHVLQVWDGTRLDRPYHECNPEEVKIQHNQKLWERTMDYVVDIYVFDNHVEVAQKFQPGQFILLKNLHAALYRNPNTRPELSAVPTIEFCLHGGTSFGRHVKVLTESSKEVVSLKQVLNQVCPPSEEREEGDRPNDPQPSTSAAGETPNSASNTNVQTSPSHSTRTSANNSRGLSSSPQTSSNNSNSNTVSKNTANAGKTAGKKTLEVSETSTSNALGLSRDIEEGDSVLSCDQQRDIDGQNIAVSGTSTSTAIITRSKAKELTTKSLEKEKTVGSNLKQKERQCHPSNNDSTLGQKGEEMNTDVILTQNDGGKPKRPRLDNPHASGSESLVLSSSGVNGDGDTGSAWTHSGLRRSPRKIPSRSPQDARCLLKTASVINGHQHIPFSTIRDVLDHSVPYKFKVQAKVLDYQPKQPPYIRLICNHCHYVAVPDMKWKQKHKPSREEDRVSYYPCPQCKQAVESAEPDSEQMEYDKRELKYVYMVEFILEDKTGWLSARIWKEHAITFLNGIPPEKLTWHEDSVRSVSEKLKDLSSKSGWSEDKPWLECCIMSYNGPCGEALYQICDTGLALDYL